jgi:methyltransferase
MVSAILYTVLVGLVAIERLAELVVAKKNLTWSLASGGRETGFGHYPFMVALHSGLLAGCVLEVWLGGRPFLPALGWPMLALVLASQALRWWCIRTLGPRWNTRIIVWPWSGQSRHQ